MSEGGLRTALGTIREEVKTRFEAQKRVLSFGEYLELVQGSPRTHTRDASRYLKDCLDFFGSYEVERPAGVLKRWKLFDLEFGLHKSGHQGELRLRDRLAGHEATQRRSTVSSTGSSGKGVPIASSSSTGRTEARSRPLLRA